MKVFRILIILLSLFTLNCKEIKSEELFECQVTRVYDGDTFYCFNKIKDFGIRLWGINAQEIRGTEGEVKKQAEESKKFLYNILYDYKEEKFKKVLCRPVSGSYNRVVSQCFILLDISEIMLENNQAEEVIDFSNNYYNYIRK